MQVQIQVQSHTHFERPVSQLSALVSLIIINEEDNYEGRIIVNGPHTKRKIFADKKLFNVEQKSIIKSSLQLTTSTGTLTLM